MADAKGQEEARAQSPTREPSRKIHAIIAERFGDAVELVDAVDPYTVIKDVTRFKELMMFLRDDPRMKFDFLRSVAGVDYPETNQIASVYHLYSYDLGHAHVVKYMCIRENPEVSSVMDIWPTANWHERESYDLTGIIYTGHHDLRRIMLPDDWVGHPLRKDYVEEPDYHGIGTTRASPLEAFRLMDEKRRKAREARGEALPSPMISPVKPPEGWVAPKKAGAAADDDAEEAEE
jgi:NADH-quinone oxidoreductase subunit C